MLAGESLDDPVIGRLVDHALDDELKGTACAVVDGPRTAVPTGTSNCPISTRPVTARRGSIVELRKFDHAQGRRRVTLAVRWDLDGSAQITATGATCLDRRRSPEEARCTRRWWLRPPRCAK